MNMLEYVSRQLGNQKRSSIAETDSGSGSVGMLSQGKNQTFLSDLKHLAKPL